MGERKTETYSQSEENQKHPLKLNIYDSSWGFRVLLKDMEERKWKWIWRPIAFFLFVLGMYLFTTWIDGTISMSGPNRLAFFDDYATITLPIILFGMLLSLKVFFGRLHTVFYDLYDNDVINEQYKEKYKEKVGEAEKCIRGEGNGKMGLYIFYFLGIILATALYYNLLTQQGNYIDSWNFYGHWAANIWTFFITYFTWAYLLPTGLWYFAATIWGIHHVIFKSSEIEPLKLRPISPDEVAGLSSLGKLALSMTYTIVIPMITVIVLLMFGEVMFIDYFILLVYVIIAFLIFFMPLITPHYAMIRAKKEELKALSDEFNRAYKEFEMEKDRSEITDEKRSAVEYMEKISVLYTQTEKMVIWPFDMAIISKFLVTVLLPFILLVLQSYFVELFLT